MKHTPAPWRVGASGYIFAGDVGSKPIAEVYGQGDECRWLPNAEFIVRTVNCHDALVAALKEAHRLLVNRPGNWEMGIVDIAERALKNCGAL